MIGAYNLYCHRHKYMSGSCYMLISKSMRNLSSTEVDLCLISLDLMSNPLLLPKPFADYSGQIEAGTV